MNTEFLATLFINGLIAIAMGVAGYAVSILVVRLVQPVAYRFLEKGLANFVLSLVRIGVLLFTLKLILDQTGAAGALVVLITAFTGALALGSERVAADLVAGMNLFLLRYYKVGDLVTIGNRQGYIAGVSLTHTSLDNTDRDRIIIPNSDILGQIIVNHTSVVGARLKARLQFDSSHDRDTIIQQMLEAAKTFEPQLRGPDDGPSVILQEVRLEYGVTISTYVARVYAPETSYGDDHKLLLHIKQAMDAHLAASAQPAVA